MECLYNVRNIPKTGFLLLFYLSYFVSLQDDIGLGSVVGSAVFNIMLVISVCAIFAGAVRMFCLIA